MHLTDALLPAARRAFTQLSEPAYAAWCSGVHPSRLRLSLHPGVVFKLCAVG